MTLATRIKERRQALGLTQEELAQKVGLQKSAIAKYENGRVENIKRSMIAKMSDALQCKPSYLMGFDEDEVNIESEMMDTAYEKGKVLGEAFKDPDQIHLLKTYQNLSSDNQGKLIQFADALALLPKSGATPL